MVRRVAGESAGLDRLESGLDGGSPRDDRVSGECGRPRTTRLDAATRLDPPGRVWMAARYIRMDWSGES
jgi:hypothetical protein